MDCGFTNFRSYSTDWPCKWVNAHWKQAYSNVWRKGKATQILKDPPKGTNFSNYRLVFLFTYGVENIDCRNKKRNLLLVYILWTISDRTKQIPQGNKRNILKENKAENCTHGMDWWPEGLWYGPVNLNKGIWKCTQYTHNIICYIITEWFFYMNYFSLIILYHSVLLGFELFGS